MSPDQASRAPGRTYVRLYHDKRGESHFEEVEFALHELESRFSTSVVATPFRDATHYGMRVVPPGSDLPWGPAARRMFAIYVSGEVEIEASDGDVRTFTAGSMLLGEDTAGKGHRAKVIGSEPVAVVHIVLPEEPA